MVCPRETPAVLLPSRVTQRGRAPGARAVRQDGVGTRGQPRTRRDVNEQDEELQERLLA